MKNILSAFALFATLTTTAFAAEKKSLDVSKCSEMWKEHKASAGYVDPGKGNRLAAWVEFRKAKCGKERTVEGAVNSLLED
jgi:hypothetical protein